MDQRVHGVRRSHGHPSKRHWVALLRLHWVALLRWVFVLACVATHSVERGGRLRIGSLHLGGTGRKQAVKSSKTPGTERWALLYASRSKLNCVQLKNVLFSKHY